MSLLLTMQLAQPARRLWHPSAKAVRVCGLPAYNLALQAYSSHATNGQFQSTGPSPEVIHVTDPGDPRLVLYRQKRRRGKHDEAEHDAQVRILTLRASAASAEHLQDAEAASRSLPGETSALPTSRSSKGKTESESECVVGLHYSWDCLRRLGEARAAGRSVLVDSLLAPCTGPENGPSQKLLSLATGLVPVIYTVEPKVFQSEFQSKEAGQAASACSFAVAYPVSQPLLALRPPILVLDEVESARNIGEILRSALHLGVTSVVASRGSWNCLTGRAARTSMGWIYHIDFHLADQLPEALQDLRASGVRIYTAESDATEAVIPHLPHGDRRWALVMGNEESGVSEQSRALSDHVVCVPQRGGASLNVANAASICLYELGRHMLP
ncbi:unnamed protein product [Polarella glacialis]|uniref:tRNA/rRNA methyltransferase SpoU type domain-containing protein n=1 Tax=Polarella glacialis TaxID=89957 RepID=A0A813K812_POLGL|nr:unnamed protein product [Polarella glacialis]